jgi:hypothetical protein
MRNFISLDDIYTRVRIQTIGGIIHGTVIRNLSSHTFQINYKVIIYSYKLSNYFIQIIKVYHLILMHADD